MTRAFFLLKKMIKPESLQESSPEDLVIFSFSCLLSYFSDKDDQARRRVYGRVHLKTWSLFITSSQPSTDAVQIKRIKMPEKQTVKENVRTSRNRNDGDAKTKLKYHKYPHKTKGATRTQWTEKKTFRNVTVGPKLSLSYRVFFLTGPPLNLLSVGRYVTNFKKR